MRRGRAHGAAVVAAGRGPASLSFRLTNREGVAAAVTSIGAVVPFCWNRCGCALLHKLRSDNAEQAVTIATFKTDARNPNKLDEVSHLFKLQGVEHERKIPLSIQKAGEDLVEKKTLRFLGREDQNCRTLIMSIDQKMDMLLGR